MADNLARGLAKQPDCELYFCGSENFQMWVNARRYLRQDPELSKVPMLSYKSAARVYGFLGRVFWDLSRDKSIPLPARALRRALGDSLRRMDRAFTPMKPESIVDKDIFHSQFFALPESTRGVRGLHRFLSVCDLINIQQPRFAQDGGAYLKSILATLSHDDWVVAISDCTKNDLLAYRPDLDPDRVRVVHLGASPDFHPVEDGPEKTEVLRRYGISDRPYYLSVCTLDARKNMEGLVRAFALWQRQEKVKDVDLVLCGSLGDSTARVRRQIEHQGLDASRVHLIGYVPDADLAPLYAGALAFVYPSFYEGFGLPVVEAMQCGVPVITSRGSSLQEIAEGAARLVNPESTEEIASALDELHRSSSERARLQTLGLERARKFSWEKSTQQLMTAYRHALQA
jgi:glycosyltransferase involved in cell wall biosynthesis